MKKLYIVTAALAAAMVILPGCKKDDNHENEKVDVMTPDQSKEYITEVGQEIANLFNPEDQADLLELCQYFEEEYGDLELPDDFTFEEEEYEYNDNKPSNPLNVIKSLRKAGKTGSPTAMTRAASYIYTYRYSFDYAAGVYEPGLYSWEKVPSERTKDIVFRFKDDSRKECELRIVRSSDSWNFEYTEEDEYEQGNYLGEIPTNLTATLKQASNELANVNLASNFNQQACTLTASMTGNIANISFSGNINGNNSEMKLDAKGTVSGTEVASYNVTLTGNKMCDLYYVSANIDENPERVIKGGNAHVSIMSGKLSADANAKLNADVLHALENSEAYGYGDNYKEDLNEMKENAELINKNISAQFYTGATKQADLIFEAEADRNGDYYDICINPMLQFSDDTILSLEEYTAKGFLSLEDTFEDLADSYKRFLGIK